MRRRTDAQANEAASLASEKSPLEVPLSAPHITIRSLSCLISAIAVLARLPSNGWGGRQKRPRLCDLRMKSLRRRCGALCNFCFRASHPGVVIIIIIAFFAKGGGGSWHCIMRLLAPITVCAAAEINIWQEPRQLQMCVSCRAVIASEL